MAYEGRCLVSEITGFSTKDGPGIRTSVFLKGCPLRCKWCSNPETFAKEQMLMFMQNRCVGCGACEEACPEGAIRHGVRTMFRIDRKKCTRCMECVDVCLHNAFRVSGQYYTVEDLMKVILRDKIFYGEDGGVTIGGGEPLMSAEFVLEIFRQCRENEVGTVLDTTGYGDTAKLREILQYTSMALLDLKVMDEEKHLAWTGVSNKKILENGKIIMETVPTRISVPFIHGVNSDPENVRATAAFAKEHGAIAIDLNPLHTLGKGKYHFLGKRSPYGRLEAPSEEELQEAAAIIESYGLPANIGRMM
ncbi:MAG: glycyl-radical enzyme activating protein [Mogibacterium sp.]|nr:glycyl-radical enzyme activating protein [Mogibacterium sp.]